MNGEREFRLRECILRLYRMRLAPKSDNSFFFFQIHLRFQKCVEFCRRFIKKLLHDLKHCRESSASHTFLLYHRREQTTATAAALRQRSQVQFECNLRSDASTNPPVRSRDRENFAITRRGKEEATQGRRRRRRRERSHEAEKTEEKEIENETEKEKVE